MPIKKLTTLLAGAVVNIMTSAEFLKLSQIPEIIKAMVDVALFTIEDVGNTYVVAPGAKENDRGYWEFPMYNVRQGTEYNISAYKLKTAINEKTKLNWFADSRSSEGLVKAFTITGFRESKTDGGKLIFPKYYYNAEVIAKHFQKEVDEVEEIISTGFNSLPEKGPEKGYYLRWMRWARKQSYKDILLPEYVTTAGVPNAEAMKHRYGDLTYEVVEREPWPNQ